MPLLPCFHAQPLRSLRTLRSLSRLILDPGVVLASKHLSCPRQATPTNEVIPVESAHLPESSTFERAVELKHAASGYERIPSSKFSLEHSFVVQRLSTADSAVR